MDVFHPYADNTDSPNIWFSNWCCALGAILPSLPCYLTGSACILQICQNTAYISNTLETMLCTQIQAAKVGVATPMSSYDPIVAGSSLGSPSVLTRSCGQAPSTERGAFAARSGSIGDQLPSYLLHILLLSPCIDRLPLLPLHSNSGTQFMASGCGVVGKESRMGSAWYITCPPGQVQLSQQNAHATQLLATIHRIETHIGNLGSWCKQFKGWPQSQGCLGSTKQSSQTQQAPSAEPEEAT